MGHFKRKKPRFMTPIRLKTTRKRKENERERAEEKKKTLAILW